MKQITAYQHSMPDFRKEVFKHVFKAERKGSKAILSNTFLWQTDYGGFFVKRHSRAANWPEIYSVLDDELTVVFLYKQDPRDNRP